jgi:hypothetical protein
MNYVPLWCRTNYSFLEGASHPDELVQAAVELGLPALAVTDRDGVYGVVRAHVKARELGLKLLLGSELTVDDGTTMTLLATDRGGWASLCRLITKGRLRSDKGQCVVGWAELCEHAEGLIALWGGERSLLASVEGPGAVGLSLKEAFGDRLYAMVTRHRREDEGLSEARLRGRAQDLGLALVAAVEVLYHTLARRPLQDVLTCIRHGVTLQRGGPPHPAQRRARAAAGARLRGAVSRPARRGGAHHGGRRALQLQPGPDRVPLPVRGAARRDHLGPVAARADLRGGAPALRRRGAAWTWAHAWTPSSRWRSIDELDYRRLLPDDVRDRASSAGPSRASCVRGAARRPTRRCAFAWASPRWTRCG